MPSKASTKKIKAVKEDMEEIKSTLLNPDVDYLHLDPHNPRLPASDSPRSESEVIDFLLKTANVLELMTSIAEKGFFPGEPLLAVKIKEKSTDNDPWYEVVEGNRRLTAVKLLNNPSLASVRKTVIAEIVDIAKHIPHHIPTVVFEDRKSILDYLGYRHITGVKAWDSLAKARYMETLLEHTQSNTTREKYKEIARIIGSKPNYVARILSGLRAYKIAEKRDFFDIPGLNAENIAFSLFTTALSYSEIANYIGIENTNNGFSDDDIDLANLKNLISWIYQEKNGSSRIGESRNLSKLAKVIGEEKALRAFISQNKTLDEALLLTDEPRELLDSALREAFSAIDLANSTWVRVKDLKHSDTEILKDIIDVVGRMRNAIQTEIASKENN